MAVRREQENEGTREFRGLYQDPSTMSQEGKGGCRITNYV